MTFKSFSLVILASAVFVKPHSLINASTCSTLVMRRTRTNVIWHHKHQTCMYGKEQYDHSLKHLLLCSTKEIRSYRFKMIGG